MSKPDPVTNTVDQINHATLTYAPAVIAGVQAAEVSGASGSNKKQAVLDGILAGAKLGENMPIPQVAAISGMIDMFVTIFNSLGLFKKSSPVPKPPVPVPQSTTAAATGAK